MTDFSPTRLGELKRLAEAALNDPEIEFTAAVAEVILALLEASDAGREWMRHAWNEFNTIRARDGAPPGVSVEWWDGVTKALGEMLGDDRLPWMTKAARPLVRPYEARAQAAESEVSHLTAELAAVRVTMDCARIKLSRYRAQHGESFIGGVAAEYDAVVRRIDAALSSGEQTP